ncbi:uncharacterized protein LOC113302449 [Papaver somniferum]|uniref:uncharacterized protein LOC113302449 n=1 Tax=Papaver somniferum TaxID=3469 RepID=UPI000E6FAB60|nr:uncharacterized protein LOC113302449 [Papaver somniferum]
MELPEDIMLDILTRLPTESILESKLVSKTWRDVVRHPFFSQKHSNRLLSAADDSGAFADEAIHWIDTNKKQTLMSFDLVDEKFREISLATLPQHVYLKPVGALGDSLMCVNNMRDGDTWLLKEKENGDMKWEVDYKSISCSQGFNFGGMEPFAVTNNGVVLCFRARATNTTVHRYDLKFSSLEVLVSLDKKCNDSPFPHMKTLVS